MCGLSHCSFDLDFPNASWYRASFQVLIVHLFTFLGELTSDPLPILKSFFVVFTIQLREFFIHSRYKSLIKYMIARNFYHSVVVFSLSGRCPLKHKSFHFGVRFIFLFVVCVSFDIALKPVDSRF